MAESDLVAAATMLGQASRVVIFTGAGMSAESGVPTFRDALTGLWQRYDPQALATPEAFHADPELVYGWYEWRRQTVRRAEPHAGHRAVAAIEARAPHAVLITQNVDDLHERAGSVAPLHLHGSLFASRCSRCSHPVPVADDTTPEPIEGRRTPPPRCPHCAAPVRPGVVWFGDRDVRPGWDCRVPVGRECASEPCWLRGSSPRHRARCAAATVAGRCGG